MRDGRSQKVKDICTANVKGHCRTTCPLSEACNTVAGDTKESFDKRMNKAAEEL
jgi:hypothetical protein